MFGLFKKQPTISFVNSHEGYHVGQPIQRAADVKPTWFRNQIANKSVKFVRCPGMYDYFSSGYIIPAWNDFTVTCNENGTRVEIPHAPAFMQPQPMDTGPIEGIVELEENVRLQVTKLPSPWHIFSKPGWSAFVMPAIFHSPFLEELHVWTGIVDYDDFHTCNFIFTAKKGCKLQIYAGTPLLHVIPFKRESVDAVYKEMSREERHHAHYKFNSKLPQLYRKVFHKKKEFKLRYEEENGDK